MHSMAIGSHQIARSLLPGLVVAMVTLGFATVAPGQLPVTDLPVTGGLTVQFEADAIGGTTGSSVAAWNATYWDGATRYVASQSSGGYQPELIVDAWNGHNSVRFNSDGVWGAASSDYASQRLVTNYSPGITVPSTGGATDYGEISLFVVAQQMEDNYNVGSGIRGIVGTGSPAQGRTLFWMEQTSNHDRAEVATTGHEYKVFGAQDSLRDDAHIMSGTFSYAYDPGSTGTEYQTATACYLDGTNGLDATFSSTYTPSNTLLRIGGETAARCFAGAIAEVVVFEHELNDAERILVENYLSSKYATALDTAADHFSGETGLNGDTGLDFDAGVFGIGSTDDGSSAVLESSLATGVGLKATSLPDGMWLLAGHNDAAHGWTSDGDYEHWSRVWAVDETFAQAGDAATIEVVFDFGLAGLALDAEAQYGILYKPTDGDDWELIDAAFTIVDDQVCFAGIPLGDTPGSVVDGYYTLGLQVVVPEPSTCGLWATGVLALLMLRRRRRRITSGQS